MARIDNFAEQMLEKIESVLLGKADNDILEYEIGGRQIKKIPFSELEIMRQKYIIEAKNLKIAADLAGGIGIPKRKVLTRFAN